MIDELKLIDNISILYDKKIVLYGAGYQGVETLKKLRELGILPAYFCDGDPRKWGRYIEGLEVLSLNELKKLDETEKLAIIITSDQVKFIDQIIEDIKWLGLRTDNVFTLFGLNVALVRSGLASKLYGGNYDTVQNMRRDIAYMQLAISRLEMRTQWLNHPNLFLVYSSTKTGSSTMKNSLNHIGIFADQFHGFDGANMFGNPYQETLLSKYSEECLDILRSRKSVKIISMVREPIGRLLSLCSFCIGGHEHELNRIPHGELYASSIIEVLSFLKDKPLDTLNWFDSELKAVLNIDVYAHPFEKDKGYTIIRNGNIEVLVMKLEKLASLEPTIAEFVGSPHFTLVNDNEAETKAYKYLYKQLRSSVKIPMEFLDFYYKDPRMSHFYSEDEIADFRKKWEQNIAKR